MARWKLTGKGVYLHANQFGQPTEWQREEINVQTGRAFRKTLKVPMYIHPDDPFCINRLLGFCVVATIGSAQPGDIEIFDFKPTPDMEPLDEEAQAMSDAERANWVNPIDGLQANIGEDFATQLLNALQLQSNKLNVGGGQSSSGEVSELHGLVRAQQKQIESLIAALSGGARTVSAEAQPAELAESLIGDYDPTLHVRDDLEPLPSNEEVEAAQRAAAGLTKTPVKVGAVRRV